ncbi:NAD-dependent epimerase/dehydratase family protein [Micromonospora chersina]
MSGLAGRRVLVTGASGTFGRHLCAALTGAGAHVVGLDLHPDEDGPVPVLGCDLTDPAPGVAYLTKEMEAALGVMISASHNPVADNGIKFFGSDGFKLSDDQENEIEQLLDQTNPDLPRPVGEDIVHYSDYFEGAQKYLSYLKSTVDVNFEGLKIVLDGANGSTSSLAPFLFGDLEADTETIGCNPDGYNINEQCGSTHPEKLAEAVLETESDFGLAFDGDGDRIIAVDENGQIVDGDQIMFIIGQEMYKNQELNGNMIVSTVMSNLGFYKALEKEGIQSNKTKVGDRYVVEEMRRQVQSVDVNGVASPLVTVADI